MNISLFKNANSIFQNGKPAFLEQSQSQALGKQNPFNSTNPATQKLADLMNGKLDSATVSDEAKELLAKLNEAKEVENTAQEDTKSTVNAFLGSVKQNLQDLATDIDSQLKNVDILESDTASAEEKLAARDNLKYIESSANLRGGIFTEDLLNKVSSSGAKAVTAAYENAKASSSAIQSIEADGDSLLKTSAKSLGLEGINEKSTTEMREILNAAKEKVLNKANAISDVETSVSKMQLPKEELSSNEVEEVNAEDVIANAIKQANMTSDLDYLKKLTADEE